MVSPRLGKGRCRWDSQTRHLVGGPPPLVTATGMIGFTLGPNLTPRDAMLPADQRSLDASVRLGILRACLDGSTPTVSVLAASLDAKGSDVAASFDRLATGRAIVLVPGTHDIRMAAPFATRPTGFRATVAGRTYNANCIWDAMGIPAMLGATEAAIDTTCADCNAPLHLDLRDGAMGGDQSVVHFAVPAARWWEDIVFT